MSSENESSDRFVRRMRPPPLASAAGAPGVSRPALCRRPSGRREPSQTLAGRTFSGNHSGARGGRILRRGRFGRSRIFREGRMDGILPSFRVDFPRPSASSGLGRLSFGGLVLPGKRLGSDASGRRPGSAGARGLPLGIRSGLVPRRKDRRDFRGGCPGHFRLLRPYAACFFPFDALEYVQILLSRLGRVPS